MLSFFFNSKLLNCSISASSLALICETCNWRPMRQATTDDDHFPTKSDDYQFQSTSTSMYGLTDTNIHTWAALHDRKGSHAGNRLHTYFCLTATVLALSEIISMATTLVLVTGNGCKMFPLSKINITTSGHLVVYVVLRHGCLHSIYKSDILVKHFDVISHLTKIGMIIVADGSILERTTP